MQGVVFCDTKLYVFSIFAPSIYLCSLSLSIFAPSIYLCSKVPVFYLCSKVPLLGIAWIGLSNYLKELHPLEMNIK